MQNCIEILIYKKIMEGTYLYKKKDEQSTSAALRLLKKMSNLTDFMNSVSLAPKLHEHLTMMRKEKNCSISELSKRGGDLDQWHVYQIFNGTKKNPSRDVVIRLAIGLGLTIEETNELLRLAKQGNLYAKVPRDMVILFGIEHNQSFYEIEEELKNRGHHSLLSLKEEKEFTKNLKSNETEKRGMVDETRE